MVGASPKTETNHPVDRIFRIVGYGTILVLLCFVSYLTAKIVITISLVGVLAYLLLRSRQPCGAFLTQSLSPRSRRSVSRVTIVSSIGFLLFIGGAYIGELLDPMSMVVTIILTWPLWLPLLVVVAFLSKGQLKRGLALAVTTYSTLFLVSIEILAIVRLWENPWWIQLVPSLAALASLTMTGMAVRTYYRLPRESHDLSKLLAALSYSVVVLFFFSLALDSTEWVEPRQTIHAQKAKTKLEEINRVISAYKTRFGGVFPENLEVLASPPQNQRADCLAAGLLDKPFTTNSGGYIFEYRTGLPSRTASGGCDGAMRYTITARPAVYGYDETGYVNLYTDESGVIRCSYEDRPANAQDSLCHLYRHLP